MTEIKIEKGKDYDKLKDLLKAKVDALIGKKFVFNLEHFQNLKDLENLELLVKKLLKENNIYLSCLNKEIIQKPELRHLIDKFSVYYFNRLILNLILTN